MKKQRLSLIAILIFSIGFINLQGQEAITSTGGSASGTGGSASYSVGQVFSKTNTGTNGSVAEGVIQPFEISIVNSIKEVKGIVLLASVYPNPTNDYLILKIEDLDNSTYTFQLYDMNGRNIQIKEITDNETSIDMSNLAPSTYFLKVTKAKQEVKTFKIIKN